MCTDAKTRLTCSGQLWKFLLHKSIENGGKGLVLELCALITVRKRTRQLCVQLLVLPRTLSSLLEDITCIPSTIIYYIKML